MIPMPLSEIAGVVGGQVHDVSREPADPVVTGPAVADSRDVEVGGLFAAFRGEHVDGHQYAAAAVEAGAAAVLCSRPVGVPAVVVADVQGALAGLARHVLDRLRTGGGHRLTVVGLTGSQGKTSTKDLIAKVLSDAGPTVATLGSFNNELGLPLTVLRAEPTTEYLVCEMGARGVGHVRELCRIAPPQVALVLNVGKAHLGEFGSQAEIARAKGELVEALPPDGVAVLNADDPLVAGMAARTSARVLTFGEGPAADVRLVDLRLGPDGRPAMVLRYAGDSVDVRLRLVGEHQARNAAAAAAVAVAVGVPLATAAASLTGVERVSKWRMEVLQAPGGVTVVNDSYNANPDSVRAALKALAALGRGRPGARTVAVLGEMRELGESSREEHDAVGRLAVRLDISQLLVVGEAARPMHLGASLEGSWGEESVFVADNAAAVDWLREHLRSGDVVLVKGSRAARLDEVADALAGGLAGGGAPAPASSPRSTPESTPGSTPESTPESMPESTPGTGP
jgi:UDP-N-acetylmuramoyl-tripeptide--D-alanyl-D-alanine ligase